MRVRRIRANRCSEHRNHGEFSRRGHKRRGHNGRRNYENYELMEKKVRLLHKKAVLENKLNRINYMLNNM